MNLQKILIADDREENRNAARVAFPEAEIVSSAKEAIEALDREKYDLILTDMQMETKTAGLEVIRKSYEKNILAYVLSHTGPSHQGESVVIRPYGGSISSKDGKRDPKTWIETMHRIQNPDQLHALFQRAFQRRKDNDSKEVIPSSVIAAMYYPEYWLNYFTEYNNK